MKCFECGEEMAIVQDEPFGRIFVCPWGHWRNQVFNTFRQIPMGEKYAA